MYPEDKLFDIYRISKPNIKEKSIKQYITVFKQYHKKVSGKDTFDWADWEWIKFQPKFLDDVNVPSTRRNYYNCIIPILLSLGMTTPPEFIEKHGKITGIENLNILEEQSKYRLAVINNNNETKKMAENNIISDKKLEKYKVKFSEIQEFVNELRSKEKFQDSLILFLMTEYYLEMKYHSLNGFLLNLLIKWMKLINLLVIILLLVLKKCSYPVQNLKL